MTLYKAVFEKIWSIVDAATYLVVKADPNTGIVSVVPTAVDFDISLGRTEVSFRELARRPVDGPGTRAVDQTWTVKVSFSAQVDIEGLIANLESPDSIFVSVTSSGQEKRYKLLAESIAVSDPKPVETDTGTQLTLTLKTRPSDIL